MTGKEDVPEGFAYPSDFITMPCFIYMTRIMELRDFIGTFFGIVKSQEEIVKRLPQSERDSISEDTSIRSIEYNYSKHRQFVNEIMISRAVESVELYLSSILREIFVSRPEILKSEGQIDIATVIDLSDMDLILDHISEKKYMTLCSSRFATCVNT